MTLVQSLHYFWMIILMILIVFYTAPLAMVICLITWSPEFPLIVYAASAEYLFKDFGSKDNP